MTAILSTITIANNTFNTTIYLSVVLREEHTTHPPPSKVRGLDNTNQIYFWLLSKLAKYYSFDTTGYYNVPYKGQHIA
jgi:hypothetical protein